MTFTQYFYKGTPFPRQGLIEEEVMKSAREMIVLGLRTGHSLKQQAKKYLAQLNFMEKTLCKYSTEPSFNKAMENVYKDIKNSSMNQGNPDLIYGIWSLNICALIIMKVLPDDDKNGIMTFKNINKDTVVICMAAECPL